jgi:hypothetical protein
MDNPTDVVAGAVAPAAAASETPAPAVETAASEPKPAPAAPAETAPAIPEAAAAPIVPPPPAPPVMPRAAALAPTPEAPSAAAPEPATQSAASAGTPPSAAVPPVARDARSRFALLAACVAVAASLGAIGGSVAVGGVSREAPSHAAAAARPESNDEVRALKESVAQLRIQVRTLSDNVAALKVGVTAVNATANTQFAKISEAIERVEKSRDQHRTAALAPSPEPTGSIAAAPAHPSTPAPAPEAKPAAKLPVLEDWVVRRVYDGAALVEGRRHGIMDIAPGESLPGLGRVQEIRREDGRWVVVTPKGLIVQRR